METELSQVEMIRDAARTIVRELGFMRSTLAGTELSASAVHALLEIDLQGATTAAHLVQVLGLDKSSVSRLIGRLMATGELEETGSAVDARVKELKLSSTGKKLVQQIHRFGREQVEGALGSLSPSQRHTVEQGLTTYAQALTARHKLDTFDRTNTIQISSGYQPGLIGRIAEMHASFYSRHVSFGQFFESKVASGVAEFAGRCSEPVNGIWVATQNGRIVGSVAVDGQDLGKNQAHLRWFILDDECRGEGVGRKLLSEAMAFCEQQKFSAVQLWTLKGLDVARKLYESFGFEMVCEKQGQQWGSVVTEQQFTRHLHARTVEPFARLGASIG